MATNKDKTIIAFDLYGTILSTSSVAKEISKQLNISDDKAGEVATVCRRYQLEYTWRLNSMSMFHIDIALHLIHLNTYNYWPINIEKYKSFSEITLNSIHHAILDLSIDLPKNISAFNDAILKAYDALTIFPDASEALELLPSKSDAVTSYIFSNGTPSMLKNSIHESDDLKPFANIFAAIISVEKTGVFKPAPEVYHHLVKSVGKNWESKEEVGSVWLVSGNPFDVVGAKSVGMKAAWVDREGKGWKDRLMGEDEEFKPDLIVKGVKDAVEGIASWDGR